MSSFLSYFANRYPDLKARNTHPPCRRRMFKLRMTQEFWRLPIEKKEELMKEFQQTPTPSGLQSVDDAADDFDINKGLAIVIRTDYTDDNAWQDFCTKLTEAENEFAMGLLSEITANPDMEDADEQESESEDEEDVNATENSTNSKEGEDTEPTPIFITFSPPQILQRYFTNISNLTALRFFNDVSVDYAPTPLQGVDRIKQPNPLIDKDGFQEIYTGKLLWIYDSQSNSDQSVRLVSQRGSGYGTATGDSWRPRVSFLPELEVNLYSGAMSIDFGGLDRWEYKERVRNLAEAVASGSLHSGLYM